MKLSLLGCATAVALLAGISSASADILTIALTGTVGSSTDTQGFFGAAGASLAGQDFTATYTFDTATPGSVEQSIGSLIQNLYGGTGLRSNVPQGLVSPLVSATLTIGAGSINMGTGALGSGASVDFGSPTSKANANFMVYAYNSIPGDELQFEFTANSGNSVPGFPSITQSGTYTLGSNVNTLFSFFERNGETINLSPLTLTVNDASEVAAVPEASTWAMMLAGFAGLGVMSYRRNRRKGGLQFRLA
jgi:hypothetical protein